MLTVPFARTGTAAIDIVCFCKVYCVHSEPLYVYVNMVGINYSIYYQYTCIDIYVNIHLRIAVTVSFVSMQSLHE